MLQIIKDNSFEPQYSRHGKVIQTSATKIPVLMLNHSAEDPENKQRSSKEQADHKNKQICLVLEITFVTRFLDLRRYGLTQAEEIVLHLSV